MVQLRPVLWGRKMKILRIYVVLQLFVLWVFALGARWSSTEPVTIGSFITFDGTQSTADSRAVFEDDAINGSEINDGTCDSVHSVVFNPTEAGATDDFVSLNEIDIATGEASFSATEDNENEFIVPLNMVANNLRVDVDVAPGAGNDDWRITLRDDTSSTALTCDISETATNCTDSSNQPAITGGSHINWLVNSDVGGGTDPTAAAEMVISFCLTHD